MLLQENNANNDPKRREFYVLDQAKIKRQTRLSAGMPLCP